MGKPEADTDSTTSPPSEREWFGTYLSRTGEYWQRAAQTTSSALSRVGGRSLREDEWTVDTVTADIVEAWEEFTPLMGEGLELWIEFVQHALRAGRPDD
jgi:hypothetical protein